VRLASVKTQQHRSDNPVTARVETLLNLGVHCQVALRCGTEQLWLAAPANLVSHHGLQPGCDIAVDLRSNALLCWPRASRAGHEENA
jgi:molybdate/tungstate transport system ATP-binding protein